MYISDLYEDDLEISIKVNEEVNVLSNQIVSYYNTN